MVGAVGAFLGFVFHGLLPQRLARLAVEAKQTSTLFPGGGLGEEDSVSGDHGARVARFGEGDTPLNVFLLVPFRGHFGFGGCPRTRQVAAPKRPVGEASGNEKKR